MPDERSADGRDTGARRRGLRFRQRDDHAVELLREAETCLGDLPRLDRILLELGRFYNPVANEPIVDLVTRRRIVECAGAGRTDEARRLLGERLALYTGPPGET